MESTVKQVSRRVKGSEKYWSTSGGEATPVASKPTESAPTAKERPPCTILRGIAKLITPATRCAQSPSVTARRAQKKDSHLAPATHK